jgi:hypothetical protein
MGAYSQSPCATPKNDMPSHRIFFYRHWITPRQLERHNPRPLLSSTMIHPPIRNDRCPDLGKSLAGLFCNIDHGRRNILGAQTTQ